MDDIVKIFEKIDMVRWLEYDDYGEATFGQTGFCCLLTYKRRWR